MEENKKLSVISIGYGKHLFEKGNPDRLRMEACARETQEFHMVVFVGAEDGLEIVRDESGLTIHPVSSKFPLFKLWKSLVVVRTVLSKLDYPMVVTAQDPFETGLVGWLATRFAKAKFNVQEHGDVFSTNFWRSENQLNFFRFYLGLFILKRADSVRVVAKRIKNTLVKRGIDPDKIKQLSVITDPSVFVDASAVSEVKDLFPADSFVFLTMARFVPQKNLKLLLDAFFEAQKVTPHIRLLMVGTGKEQAKIEQIIKSAEEGGQKDLVKILPWTNNVPGFMKSVDSYVLSSNYEGWARVLLEAKYARLPIVTTDVGCVGEEVFDEVHGLVVPLNNQESMAKALIGMASDKNKYEKYKQEMSAEAIPEELTYEAYAKVWITTLK